MRTRFTGLAFFSIVAVAATAGHAADKPDRRIIDMHLHAYPAQPAAPNPVTGQPNTATTDEELQQKTLAALRELGSVKAVASGPLPFV